MPKACCAISRTRRMSASGAVTISRRVMSTSSGFGPSSAVGVIGSSAMPQIGQDPGPSRTISGCIGQVHLTPGAAVGAGFGASTHGAVAMGGVVMRAVVVAGGGLRLQVLRRIGNEFPAAALRAEMIGDAVVLVGRLALPEVDRHAAHRVDSRRRRLGGGRLGHAVLWSRWTSSAGLPIIPL